MKLGLVISYIEMEVDSQYYGTDIMNEQWELAMNGGGVKMIMSG